MDSLSYSIGVLMANNLKNQGVDSVNLENMATGIADVMNGNDLKIEMDDVQSIVNKYFQSKQQAKQQAAMDEEQVFLAKNGKRPEVTALPNGIQYEVMKAGSDGPSPAATDTVTVNYKGSLLDGTVFDSSYKRGQPATFPLNQVIKGWTEILQLMKVGDQWRVYIPQELGYGSRGAGRDIPPFATLIFEIELLGIK